MQDGNHLIARVADSHMPTSIMESEVRRLFWRCGGRPSDQFFVSGADRDDAVGPRTVVDPCA